MKRLLLLFTSFFLFFGLSISPLEAQSDSSERLIIQSDEPITGPLIKLGQSVNLQGTVDGDVILIAGEAVVDATISGDLIIFAGQIDVQGQVQDDLRLAGGQVNLNAQVNGDASIAAGQVTLQPDTIINNHLVIAAGLIDHQARVLKNAWLSAGRLRFNGQSSQNVFITAVNTDIYSDADIDGDLKITYGQKPVISNRASISGQLIEEKSAALQVQSKINKPKSPAPVVKKLTAFVAIEKLISLSLHCLLGWLLISLLPQLSKRLIVSVQKSPDSVIGWGLLAILFIPAISGLLLITLIGLPLSVLIFVYYLILLYLARLTAGLLIGHQLLKDKDFKKPYFSLFLGLVILSILKLIPLIGWLIYFIFILFGLGSLTLEQKRFFNQLKRKK